MPGTLTKLAVSIREASDDLDKELQGRMRHNLMQGLKKRAAEGPGMHGVRRAATVTRRKGQPPPLPMDTIKDKAKKAESVSSLRSVVAEARSALS